MQENENSLGLKIRKIFWDIVIIILLTISVLLGAIVGSHYFELHLEQDKFERLAKEKEYKSYAKLKKKNPDLVGWIKMKKTIIDYPVMLPPKSDPFLYEHHDFDKNYSFPGTIFIDEGSDLENSRNTIMYGHHMFNGTMFGNLQKYVEQGKRTFTYDKILNDKGTIYEHGKYEVVAAFKTSTKMTHPFQDYVTITDNDTYTEYIDTLKERNELETDVDIEMGDDILSLVTCSYHIWTNGHVNPTGRYLVVAKKINATIVESK